MLYNYYMINTITEIHDLFFKIKAAYAEGDIVTAERLDWEFTEAKEAAWDNLATLDLEDKGYREAEKLYSGFVTTEAYINHLFDKYNDL